MNGQQIGLLLIQFAVSILMLAFIGIYLLRMREERHRYRLFAVRDNLLYLVASKQLAEDSFVFQVFYRAMNIYASELDSLTLMSFAHASMAVKTELERQNQKRLSEALQQASPEVQHTIFEFVQAVMDALRYNSPMLNLSLVFSRRCVNLFHLARKYRKYQSFKTPLYDTYRYYEGIPGKLGIA